MKILFAAAEGLPYIKSGGLADVIGSLPKILMKKRVDVRVVLPLYLKMAQHERDDFEKIGSAPIHSGMINTVATYYKKETEGITYYFIEHQGYFEREGLYGYTDDGERFTFFQKAILEMLSIINFYPDILHCHDWHTGMIPVLCKTHYADVAKMQKIRFVYTIHNLIFQGNFPKEMMSDCLALPWDLYHDGSLRFYEGISFMKAGILYADKITTVSPTYAQEIFSPYFGEDMQDVLRLRQDDLSGIVNGIDIECWNPMTDFLLEQNYDGKTYHAGKAANKKRLQSELGLREDPEVIMIGIVSRLTSQKGLQLVVEKMHDLMSMDVQLVVLGTGEKQIEHDMRMMENRYHRRAVYYCGYNEDLAHHIYAGSDLFLMPSYFEPCGISQLIAMRYGTLPLVRETGGLKDTVQPYNQYTQEGNGFSFYAINGDDMLNSIRYAMDTYYYSRAEFDAMIKRAMKTDVSWKRSAEKYLDLYKSLKETNKKR